MLPKNIEIKQNMYGCGNYFKEESALVVKPNRGERATVNRFKHISLILLKVQKSSVLFHINHSMKMRQNKENFGRITIGSSKTFVKEILKTSFK